MNGITNRNSPKVQKPNPGCFGRMVSLFDSNAGVPKNKLLTEGPHRDGYLACKNNYEGRTSSSSGNFIVDKMIGRISSNGTTVKKLMAQEMSTELEFRHSSPPNVVARLMGLESYPCRPTDSNAKLCSLGNSPSNEYKDVHEVCQLSGRTPFTGSMLGDEDVTEKRMALIRRKFMEAKQLSTDEKLRQSREFQDALEILNSNKDLFLKFLQETNSLFSQYDMKSIRSPPRAKRITLLRPSKAAGTETAGETVKGNGLTMCKNGSCPAVARPYDSPKHSQPTRIVVLKPCIDEPQVGGSPSRDRVGPALVSSSVVANGYTGDESSSNKSENEYDSGALSDMEFLSPSSRHSWDGGNRFGSGRSYMSASSSPETSSVCREAKKRLSARWAMMATVGSDEREKEMHKSSCTLGEMLGFPDVSNPVRPGHDGASASGQPHGAAARPTHLQRSNSAPEAGVRSHPFSGTGKTSFERSSSFKGKISSLFSSRNRRKSKEVSANKYFSEGIEEKVISGMPQSARGNNLKDIVLDNDHGHFSEKVVVHTSEHPAAKAECNGVDQPSPDSVLEPPFEENDNTAPAPKSSSDVMTSQQLIGKSPRIESISRTPPLQNHFLNKDVLRSSSFEEDEHDGLHYVHALLSASGFNIRSNRKLIRDCVSAVLLEVAGSSREELLGNVAERVRGLLVDWDGRVDGGGGDWPSAAAERLVKREMEAGSRGWGKPARDEVDNVGQEIEGTLVEELVEEAVIELTHNVY